LLLTVSILLSRGWIRIDERVPIEVQLQLLLYPGLAGETLQLRG